MELLREFLRAYERVSGQLINGMKSSFIVGRQVSSLQTQAVQYVLGYQLKHLPVTYLGVPLYKGSRKACLFDSIISRLRDMLQGWAMTNLSHGGKLAFIQSVLQATPLHLLQVIHPAKLVLTTIERIFNGFFWSPYYGRRHIHWSSWAKACFPVAEVWHCLCRIRDVAEPFIFWILGEGSVSFWYDNWLGEKPLAQLLHRDTYTMEPMSYYWHKSDWNVPWILRTVSIYFAQTICQIPIAAEEMVSHLFIESTAVQGVRQHFAALFGLCLCNTGNLTHIRNAAKYRGVPFSTNGIILEVQCYLRTLYAARTLTSKQWKGDLHRVGVIGFIFRQTIPLAPSFVCWRAPSPSWFKINTEGSSFGNPGLAGVAGIIRDSVGHVHLAYQVALGTGTSVLAELTAVWRGLELALTQEPPWWWREANRAADHLATEIASLQLTQMLHHNDITGVLRGILCLDRRGVPHLRRGDDGFTTWTRSFGGGFVAGFGNNGNNTWGRWAFFVRIG
ncbi:UNVERIFIED_CONTAM: putative ribonuclease H protein [Sesamum calycinum]|uniref:Ribonuclease H protein n=1 Tax=Sesamum calycinum TaxID=2727403 RepID=A0AAW2KN51_9LAMI